MRSKSNFSLPTHSEYAPCQRQTRKFRTSHNGDCTFCYKIEENIDHTLKDCDLAINNDTLLIVTVQLPLIPT